MTWWEFLGHDVVCLGANKFYFPKGPPFPTQELTMAVHAGEIESIRFQSIINLVNFNEFNFNSNFLEVKFNQFKFFGGKI